MDNKEMLSFLQTAHDSINVPMIGMDNIKDCVHNIKEVINELRTREGLPVHTTAKVIDLYPNYKT